MLVLHFNNQIDLPELPPNDQHCRVCKIVLSANPSSTNNYNYVAVAPNFQLAFLKPGDKSWTCLPIHLIRDVISFKDQFYAIDSLSRLYICDLKDSVPKITNVEPPPYFCTVELFLVESSGDLLKVCRLANVTDDYELFVDYHKGGIRVIKLDPVTFEWIKVDDLQGRALFLGGNTSMSVLASEFPGCIPNAVYITEDYYGKKEQDGLGPHDVSVFNLDDDTIDRYCLIETNMRTQPTIWIEPTL